MPGALESNPAGPNLTEHIVPRGAIPDHVYRGYAIFKEVVYRHLHGLTEFPFRQINAVPGYTDYMDLSAIYSQKLRSVLANQKIDVIHFHDYQVMPGIAAVPLGLPSLFSLHAPLLPSISEVLSNWLLQYWSRTAGVIVSIPAYAAVAQKLGLDPKKIFVIPPVADIDALDRRPANAPLPQIPENAIVITCIQRFDSKSGQAQLIRAFYHLQQKIDSVVLVLVGGKSYTDTIATLRSDYFEEMVSLVEELQLGTKVFFTGNVDYYSLGAIYDASDVIVMLSKMECFGLAVAEAMYKARPVVVTNVGGLAFQVADGSSGFVIPVGDIPQTVATLTRLCNSPGLRQSMGQIGRARFMSEFSPDKLIGRYAEVYDVVLNAGEPPDYRSMYNSLR